MISYVKKGVPGSASFTYARDDGTLAPGIQSITFLDETPAAKDDRVIGTWTHEGSWTIHLPGGSSFFSKMLDAFWAWYTPFRWRRRCRRQRAAERRAAQNLFREASRRGVRMEISAAEAVRRINAWRAARG